MNFLYGLLTATAAIIAAEIAFNYSLGDVVKDFFIRVFAGAEQLATAKYNRAKARYDLLLSRAKKAL